METRKQWLASAIGLALAIGIYVSPLQAGNVIAEGNEGHTAQNSGKWELTFADEFESTVLDRSKWNTDYILGQGAPSMGQLQYYLPEQLSVLGGRLQIAAEARPVLASVLPTWPVQTFPYRSGVITTRGKFAQEYGRFEIRCKVPKGKGLWIAFWMLTDGPKRPEDLIWPPEIDVMEFEGGSPNRVAFQTHWGNDLATHTWKGSTVEGFDITSEFHTYAVDWLPDRVVYYMDGVERGRTDPTKSEGPMYMIVNFSVGGLPWPGHPDVTTPFPSYLLVDYVRAYKWVSASGSLSATANGHVAPAVLAG